MKQLIKRLAQFSLGTILATLLSGIQIPILTYFLLPEDYGQAGLFRNLIIQVPPFLYLGIDHAFSREYRNKDNRTYLLSNSIILPLILSMMLSVLLYFYSEELSIWLFNSPQYDYIVKISTVWLILIIFERFILLSFRMEDMAKQYSFYTLLIKVVTFIITMIMVYLGIRNFTVIVIGLLFGNIVPDVVLIIKYRKYLRFSFNDFDPTLVKQMLIFGFPQMIALTLTSFTNTTGNLFINNYTTTFELGIYNLGITIISLIGVLRTAFTTFWLPTAYKWKSEKKTLKHYEFINKVVVFGCSVVFYLMILFLPLIRMVIGEDYEVVIYIIPILSLQHIFFLTAETTSLGIVFNRKTYLSVVVAILMFIISIGLNLTLTPIIGYKGASLTISVTAFAYYVIITYFSRKTGFYIKQKRQVVAMLLMFIASLLIMLEYNDIFWLILLLAIITIFTLSDTYTTILNIKKNPEDWDFT
ncbi:polysaccharide biosynthesis protein [Ruoffia tabacinasalis]|uniref:Polysaccharide biosynthesis protein n=1 Tax=Ruoffia tabacinasalis TaxID=87458 RepID=A0A5R9DSV9_9LACT|nr:oligosaccharide flippase family protein [Ruoffia tabacinasalis]TLQ39889.1 polysaccharide biosynthesis protein [Ruoffia tabacinasalis]